MFVLLFGTIGIIAVAATLVLPTLFIRHAQQEGVNKSLADALVIVILCILPFFCVAGIQCFLFITRSMGWMGSTVQPPGLG